jgi:hypothetical protein
MTSTKDGECPRNPPAARLAELALIHAQGSSGEVGIPTCTIAQGARCCHRSLWVALNIPLFFVALVGGQGSVASGYTVNNL